MVKIVIFELESYFYAPIVLFDADFDTIRILRSMF